MSRNPVGLTSRHLFRLAFVLSATLALLTSNFALIASAFHDSDAAMAFSIDGSVPDAAAGSAIPDACVDTGDTVPKNGDAYKLNHIQDQDAPVFQNQKANQKSDLCNIWVATQLVDDDASEHDGHLLLYIAWERAATSGSVKYAIEFHHEEFSCDVTDLAGCNPFADRVHGDFVLVFDFQGNPSDADAICADTGEVTLGMQTWNGTSFSTPLAALPANSFEACVSGDTQFGEAVIDLATSAVPPIIPPIGDDGPTECESLSAFIPLTITGNSPADSAEMIDVVLTEEARSITNCGNVVVEKAVVGGNDFGQDFSISLSDGDGLIHGEGLGHGDSFTVEELFAAADLEVSEDLPDGWLIDSIVCSDGSSSGADETSLSGISVTAGETTTCTVTNSPKLPTITLVKTAVGDHIVEDDFQAGLDGGDVDWDATSQVVPGDHDIAEAIADGSDVQPGWFEAGDWSCDNGDGGAAGGTTVSVGLGDEVTCSITNTELGSTLTLHKIVTNDDGGNDTQDNFQARIDGDAVDWDTVHDVEALVEHVASEDDPFPGYEQGVWTGDCAADGTVTLDPGQDGECTIVNDDIAAMVTVLKEVTNDDGGTAAPGAFDLLVDGVSHVHGDDVIVASNTDIAVGENGLPGYEQTSISCDDGTSLDGEGEVTLNLDEGEHVTCTIFNDDLPGSLTLVKEVVNDNGGDAVADDFQGFLDGNPVDWDVAVELAAGDHVASEDTLDGYTPSDWGGDCAADGSVSLANGEHLTCTIVNDDVAPTVTVIKQVINDNGGNEGPEDVTLHVDAADLGTGETVEVDANTDVVVGEDLLPGYVMLSIDCDDGTSLSGEDLTVTLDLDEGEDVTCTITNDDLPPAITIVKDVSNDDGGTATAGDFELLLDGEPVTSGETVETTSNEPHVATEGAQDAYVQVGLLCVDDESGEPVAHPVVLDEGQSVTCTIVNDDLPADIDVVKNATGGVTDDGEGNLVATFDPTDDDDETVTYTYVVTNTGDVTLVNVTLVDDVLGPIVLPDTTLEPGESVTVTAVHTLSADDPDTIVNVATVTGDPIHGAPTVEALDDETVSVIEVLPEVLVKTGVETLHLVALALMLLTSGAVVLEGRRWVPEVVSRRRS